MKSQTHILSFLLLSFLVSCGGSESADADSGKCIQTNCHGLQVTCGFGEEMVCTSIYQLGDFCRSFVTCEANEGTCSPKENTKYQQCSDCVKGCESKEASEAFTCEADCRVALEAK